MRYAKPSLVSVAVLFVLVVIIANWRAHRETREKLDALAESIAARPAATSAPASTATSTPAATASSEPGPLPASVVQTGATLTREPEQTRGPVHIIEAPDVLVIEALLQDPRSKLTEPLPVQPVSGDFLVRLDGTVNLGVWGTVPVAGLSPMKAGDAVRRKIAAFTQVNGSRDRADSILVTVEVKSNNSKAYYVFLDGAAGEQVIKLPMSGKETVLDAIAAIPGLAAKADQRQIRISRKGGEGEPFQSLAVDWSAIVQRGDTRTNYILLPGDRVYVTSQR